MISTNTLKYFLLLQNNQNRQKDKLVNMVSGNDLINIIIGHNYIFDLCFLNPDVYILKPSGI